MSKEEVSEAFQNPEKLKERIKELQNNAQTAINKYNALINSAVGKFPKHELELVDFIEKVLKMHEVI